MTSSGTSDFRAAAEELMLKMNVLLEGMSPSASQPQRQGSSAKDHSKELSAHLQAVSNSLNTTLQTVPGLPGADRLSEEQTDHIQRLNTQNTLKSALVEKLAKDERLLNVLKNGNLNAIEAGNGNHGGGRGGMNMNNDGDIKDVYIKQEMGNEEGAGEDESASGSDGMDLGE